MRSMASYPFWEMCTKYSSISDGFLFATAHTPFRSVVRLSPSFLPLNPIITMSLKTICFISCGPMIYVLAKCKRFTVNYLKIHCRNLRIDNVFFPSVGPDSKPMRSLSGKHSSVAVVIGGYNTVFIDWPPIH